MGRRFSSLRFLEPALAVGFSVLLLVSCSSRPPYEGKSVAQLEAMLKSSEPAKQVQGCYGLALGGEKSGPAVPALIELLHSPNTLLRQNAALALGKIGPAAGAAVPALTQTLSDSDWRVRRQAALALGGIGPEAAPATAELAKLSRDLPAVRDAAADALARIHPTPETK